MAKQHHIDIFKAGRPSIIFHLGEYRKAKRSDVFLDLTSGDFENLEFTDAEFLNCDFTKINLRGLKFDSCKFLNCQFAESKIESCRFLKCRLAQCDFGNSMLSKCELLNCQVVNETRFSNASLDQFIITQGEWECVDFKSATMVDAKVFQLRVKQSDLQSSNFECCDMQNVVFDDCDISKTMLRDSKIHNTSDHKSTLSYNYYRCNLSETVFARCDFLDIIITESSCASGCLSECIVNGLSVRRLTSTANFVVSTKTNLKNLLVEGSISGTCLVDVDLTHANFVNANVHGCDVSGANFFRAKFDGTIGFCANNLHRAKNLDTIILTSNCRIEDVEESPRSWFNRNCDWEVISVIGKLPLFGVSWSVLTLSMIYIYFYAWYNSQIDKLNSATIGREYMPDLHRLPVPSQIALTFISSVFLAIASTIYAISCPSRVKEFSRSKWCDELGKPLLVYWFVCWRRPVVRRICGYLYFVGGCLAIIVIAGKLYKAGRFIAENMIV